MRWGKISGGAWVVWELEEGGGVGVQRGGALVEERRSGTKGTGSKSQTGSQGSDRTVLTVKSNSGRRGHWSGAATWAQKWLCGSGQLLSLSILGTCLGNEGQTRARLMQKF